MLKKILGTKDKDKTPVKNDTTKIDYTNHISKLDYNNLKTREDKRE